MSDRMNSAADREYDELVRRIENMTPAEKRAHIAELHRALGEQYARDEHALQRRADRMARRRAQKLAEKAGRVP